MDAPEASEPNFATSDVVGPGCPGGGRAELRDQGHHRSKPTDPDRGPPVAHSTDWAIRSARARSGTPSSRSVTSRRSQINDSADVLAVSVRSTRLGVRVHERVRPAQPEGVGAVDAGELHVVHVLLDHRRVGGPGELIEPHRAAGRGGIAVGPDHGHHAVVRTEGHRRRRTELGRHHQRERHGGARLVQRSASPARPCRPRPAAGPPRSARAPGRWSRRRSRATR